MRIFTAGIIEKQKSIISQKSWFLKLNKKEKEVVLENIYTMVHEVIEDYKKDLIEILK